MLIYKLSSSQSFLISATIFFIQSFPNGLSDNLPTCQPSDFQYAFTECDKYQGRYRVSIPVEPGKCVGGAPNAPVRVPACYTSCERGTFFNSTSLSCEPCKAGFYSLGGGIKFTSFNQATFNKSGFVISTAKELKNCSGWHLNNGIIENKLDSPFTTCSSVLTYSVNIVKTGKISFKYQFIEPEDPNLFIFFTFQHYNLKEPRTYNRWSDPNGRQYRPTKDKSKWKTVTLDITEPGSYSFHWRTIFYGTGQGRFGPTMFFQKRSDESLNTQNTHKKTGLRSMRGSILDENSSSLTNELGVIRIRSIEVYGVSYTSECSPCEPGTYSDQPASYYCSFCPKDTFADEIGSSHCKPCDTRTSFSFVGSSKCLSRPLCTIHDYFETVGSCDLRTRKRVHEYHWIEPKICSEAAITLPEARQEICDPFSDSNEQAECSPGMEFINGTCVPCAENHYNNGTMAHCEPCPYTTLPIYSFVLNVWKHPLGLTDRFPIGLDFMCIPTNGNDQECTDDQPAWKFIPGSPSYIRSSTTISPSSLLLLTLNTIGFHSYEGGKVSFRFQMFCKQGDDCILSLLCIREVIDDQRILIKQWYSNTTGIQQHAFTLTENVTFSLKWVFTRESTESHVRIYQITATNLLFSGAIECKPCPLDVQTDCMPCPVGNYINATGETVEDHNAHKSTTDRDKRTLLSATGKYRKQTTIKSSNQLIKTSEKIDYGESKCVLCPANTIVNKSLQFPVGLDQSCIPCGPGLVASDDRSFCYVDCNLTLGSDVFNLSTINSTLTLKGVTLFSDQGAGYFHLFNVSVCGLEKATCVNNITQSDDFDDQNVAVRSQACQSIILPSHNLSTQSVPLGDEIIAVTHETIYDSIAVHSEFNNTRSDIHIYMVTRMTTSTCTKGRSTVVTLRCEPSLESESILIPPRSCPDGTCDGCNFHFMIKTRTSAACRLCKDDDYDTVITECVDGHQEIHYINPRGCILTPTGNGLIKHRTCSMIPKSLKMVIMIICVIGIILVSLVFHFWKVNRKLEYKYSMLVENKNTAESCAMDEEDDEPEVRIKSRNRKDKNNSSSDYETIQLTKHSQDDVL